MHSKIMQAQFRYLFSNSIRVRYAPSPTGPMHLGAVRTAMINYVFAVKNEGSFILRIQDTDLQRNVQDGAKHIYQTLNWLGIIPHQSFMNKKGRHGPYVQSQRLAIYKQVEKKLLKQGLAYPCFCSGKQTKDTSKTYDGVCRKLSIEQIKEKIKSGHKYAVRIKSDIPELQISTFQDENYGEVNAARFDDFIIVKSNGLPTYHFANVIDDWQMGITHVIRGAQWLTSTPKHIYLYRIFGVSLPKFLHLPLLFTSEGKKLSKRDPTAPIDNLKGEGYQAEAIINYAGLLGRNTETPLKTEFLKLPQLIQLFQPSELSNSPIKFDNKKLNFFNRHYMRQKWKAKDHQFMTQIYEYLRKCHNLSQQSFSNSYLQQVIDCVIDRINKFSDLKEFIFFFIDPSYANHQTLQDLQKLFGTEAKATYHQQTGISLVNYDINLYTKNQLILHNLLLIFEHIIAPDQYNKISIGQRISQFLKDNSPEVKNEDIYHLLRVGVIGRKSGPNIVQICQLFGQERVVGSLRKLQSIFDQRKSD